MTIARNLSELANGVDSNGILTHSGGGTGTNATPTAGAVVYADGTKQAYTLAGTTGQVLTSNGSGAPTWAVAEAGAKSGVFYENNTTVAADYTITSGKNAMTAGPISIADGVTVTIPDGSTWVIV